MASPVEQGAQPFKVLSHVTALSPHKTPTHPRAAENSSHVTAGETEAVTHLGTLHPTQAS